MSHIFVIDSNTVFRRGLVSMLEEYPEFQVVGDAANVSEALDKLDELQLDIAIMGAFMPGYDGAEAITLLRQKLPNAKVLIITESNKEEDFFKAIKAGVNGYLLKDVGLTELIESIRLVASSNVIVSPMMTGKLLTKFGGAFEENKDGFNRLSPREKEVLRLVARGASNKEVAAHCCVSEAMVKAHLRRILEKLRARNKAQAVALAAAQGLLDQS